MIIDNLITVLALACCVSTVWLICASVSWIVRERKAQKRSRSVETDRPATYPAGDPKKPHHDDPGGFGGVL